MPETINEKPVFSLLEVTLSIRKTLAERYQSAFWVKAEMNKLNFYAHSGHCYPELVEKKDGKVVAQLKATLWKEDYNRINAQFQTVLKEPLKNGIKILFCARITFDPGYGLSLHILDIDPAYSLGELEKEKAETIERLLKEGLYDKNKKLPFPLLPQRMAVISVETSKGYADFIKMISENQWGYCFFHLLFPALLQGENAIPAIRAQLQRIRKVIHHFDVVVIVRGGGGDVGLSCYNNYLLSKDVADFPIPVLTGIGHATNETVVEIISYKNAITPTALAEFLIQSFHNFAVPLQKAEEYIVDHTQSLLKLEKANLNQLGRHLQMSTRNILLQNSHRIASSTTSILQHIKFGFKNEREKLLLIPLQLKKSGLQKIGMFAKNLLPFRDSISMLSASLFNGLNKDIDHMEKIIKSMNPENVLSRGYSITRINGKTIKDIKQVKAGDKLETTLYNGVIESKTEKLISKKKKNDQ